jgi:hypothetical protein
MELKRGRLGIFLYGLAGWLLLMAQTAVFAEEPFAVVLQFKVSDTAPVDVAIHEDGSLTAPPGKETATVTIVNGKVLLWGQGSTHTLIGQVRIAGCAFDSDQQDPLQFMVDRDKGDVYLKGRGTVAMPDGRTIRLPLANQDGQANQNGDLASAATSDEAPSSENPEISHSPAFEVGFREEFDKLSPEEKKQASALGYGSHGYVWKNLNKEFIPSGMAAGGPRIEIVRFQMVRVLNKEKGVLQDLALYQRIPAVGKGKCQFLQPDIQWLARKNGYADDNEVLFFIDLDGKVRSVFPPASRNGSSEQARCRLMLFELLGGDLRMKAISLGYKEGDEIPCYGSSEVTTIPPPEGMLGKEIARTIIGKGEFNADPCACHSLHTITVKMKKKFTIHLGMPMGSNSYLGCAIFKDLPPGLQKEALADGYRAEDHVMFEVIEGNAIRISILPVNTFPDAIERRLRQFESGG